MHMPGKTNPADVLSRLPLEGQPNRERQIAEEYINYIASNAVSKTMSQTEIVTATKADPLLQMLRESLLSGKWLSIPELRPLLGPLRAVRFQWSHSPWKENHNSYPAMTLELAHEGHQGIVRTKQLLREKVWWPGIDHDVQETIQRCLSCQSMSPKSPPEPVRPSTMPRRPWEIVHVDPCGPFPSGESLLILVDACSRWPEVAILRSTTADAIIKQLKRIFATHGLPETITSDNGPQFVSKPFQDFLDIHGIRHRKVTPYRWFSLPPCWWTKQKKIFHVVCIKIEVNSHRRKILLFLSTNMAAMTSHAKQMVKLNDSIDPWRKPSVPRRSNARIGVQKFNLS